LIALALVGDVVRAECGNLDLAGHIEKAESAVIDDELEEARRLVVDVLEWLPCTTEPLDANLVSALWQVSAAIEFYGASVEAAEADLARAKAIPGALFRSRLGTDLRALWEEAVPKLDAELVVSPVPAPNLLIVDGVPRTQTAVMLSSGPHIVQIWSGEVVVFQREVNLNLGQRAEIETGLEVEVLKRSSPAFLRSPLFWGGVTGTVSALGFYGHALYKDGQMKTAQRPDIMMELRNESTRSRNVALILGGVSVASFSFHLAF